MRQEARQKQGIYIAVHQPGMWTFLGPDPNMNFKTLNLLVSKISIICKKEEDVNWLLSIFKGHLLVFCFQNGHKIPCIYLGQVQRTSWKDWNPYSLVFTYNGFTVLSLFSYLCIHVSLLRKFQKKTASNLLTWANVDACRRLVPLPEAKVPVEAGGGVVAYPAHCTTTWPGKF